MLDNRVENCGVLRQAPVQMGHSTFEYKPWISHRLEFRQNHGFLAWPHNLPANRMLSHDETTHLHS